MEVCRGNDDIRVYFSLLSANVGIHDVCPLASLLVDARFFEIFAPTPESARTAFGWLARAFRIELLFATVWRVPEYLVQLYRNKPSLASRLFAFSGPSYCSSWCWQQVVLCVLSLVRPNKRNDRTWSRIDFDELSLITRRGEEQARVVIVFLKQPLSGCFKIVLVDATGLDWRFRLTR